MIMPERGKYIGKDVYDVNGNLTKSAVWGVIPNTHELGIERTPGAETHFVPVFQGSRFQNRRLAVEVTGSEDGHPVLFYPGMPGGRLGPKPDASLIPGVRLFVYDSPGVTVIRLAILLEQFSVVGRSRGAQRALAVASIASGVDPFCRHRRHGAVYKLVRRKHSRRLFCC
jgi:hypothetical protein